MLKETNSAHSTFNEIYLFSKEEFEKDIPNKSHKWIAYCLQHGFDRLIGDLLTLIEMLGLPETQESAIKAQVRKAYYERYGETADALIKLPFALMEILTPREAGSLTTYQPTQNPNITGCVVPSPLRPRLD